MDDCSEGCKDSQTRHIKRTYFSVGWQVIHLTTFPGAVLFGLNYTDREGYAGGWPDCRCVRMVLPQVAHDGVHSVSGTVAKLSRCITPGVDSSCVCL